MKLENSRFHALLGAVKFGGFLVLSVLFNIWIVVSLNVQAIISSFPEQTSPKSVVCTADMNKWFKPVELLCVSFSLTAAVVTKGINKPSSDELVWATII